MNPYRQTITEAALLPERPDLGVYFLQLGLRVQKVVRDTPNGLSVAVRTLDRAVLLDSYRADLDDVPRALVMGKARLEAMSVPGDLPSEVTEKAEAREQLQHDSLRAWLSAVMRLPHDRDR